MSIKKMPRRKIFVNRKAQGQLLLRFVGYWLVYHLVLMHTLFIFEFIRVRVAMMNSGTSATFSKMYYDFWATYYPIAISAGLLLPFLVYDLIKNLHRIVGPVLRFQNELQRLREGKPVKDVKLRDGDLMSDFEKEFNLFLAHYRERLGSASSNDQIASSLEKSPETPVEAEDRLLTSMTDLQREANQTGSDHLDAIEKPEHTSTH